MGNNKKYLFQFTAVCLSCFILSFCLSKVNSAYLHTAHFWLPVIFFAITTWAIHVFLTQGDTQSKEFVFKALALSMARLLICLVLVLIYSRINKAGALAFTCHFMLQYAVFTIFEVMVLLKHIKQPIK